MMRALGWESLLISWCTTHVYLTLTLIVYLIITVNPKGLQTADPVVLAEAVMATGRMIDVFAILSQAGNSTDVSHEYK